MGCAKDGTRSALRSSKSTRAQYKNGLKISNYADPFQNPENVVSPTWIDKKGQINQKIVGGPDKGVHRFVDPNIGRTGQTGVTRFAKNGTEYRQK